MDELTFVIVENALALFVVTVPLIDVETEFIVFVKSIDAEYIDPLNSNDDDANCVNTIIVFVPPLNCFSSNTVTGTKLLFTS